MKKIKRKNYKKRENLRWKLKKKKRFSFFLSQLYIIPKFFILMLIIFYTGFIHIYYMRSISLNNEIIETKEYKNFDDIKKNITDPSIESILQKINIIKHIFAKDIRKYKNSKNIIHITVSINNDENYKYFLFVSIYSVLSNCNKRKTFVIYHILCSYDFSESSIIIFKSLFKKYSHNLEMIFYNMGNLFIKYENIRTSQTTYYRILTPYFISEDRIIHLDGDTLTFSDLSEMYNLDFNDNYILGFYDVISGGVDYLGIKSDKYINAGVILLNLKKIREDKKTFELYNMAINDITLYNGDQTILNYVLFPKIGRFPSKYVIFNFEDEADIKVYLKFIRTKIPFEELVEAFKNPVIIHSVLSFPKLWSPDSLYSKRYTNCVQRNNCNATKYIKLWHSIAKKSDYYDIIANITKINKLISKL